MTTRLKPTKIKSTALDAPTTVKGKVICYQLHVGTTRDGDAYEEDQVHFLWQGIQRYMALNQRSLVMLASRGIDVSEDGLAVELPGMTLTWELVTNSGPYPFYVITKVVAPRAKEKAKS